MSKLDFDKIARGLAELIPAFLESGSFRGYRDSVQTERDGAVWHSAIWQDFLGFLKFDGGIINLAPGQVKSLAEYINTLYQTYGVKSLVIHNLEADFFEGFAGWVATTEEEERFITELERFLTGEAREACSMFRTSNSIVDIDR